MTNKATAYLLVFVDTETLKAVCRGVFSEDGGSLTTSRRLHGLTAVEIAGDDYDSAARRAVSFLEAPGYEWIAALPRYEDFAFEERA